MAGEVRRWGLRLPSIAYALYADDSTGPERDLGQQKRAVVGATGRLSG
jgi:hypothetical protein